MTQDDVLFGYRLRLFDLAGRTTVTHACRVFGVHRSTYYRWKQLVEHSGLEMLRPRERRRPVMPNQLPQNFQRAHTGRITHGCVPADRVYGAAFGRPFYAVERLVRNQDRVARAAPAVRERLKTAAGSSAR